MKKIILTLLILFTEFGFSQEPDALKFDTPYYRAVDHWVAFPKKESDSTFVCGFIYIDQMAGFTFDYCCSIKLTQNGFQNIGDKPKTSSFKQRLSKRTRPVAVLSESQLKELNLPKEPDWLSIYKNGEGSVSYSKDIGLFYNDVGASDLALPLLEKAYAKKPHYEGLEFELAFAYNALKKYNKAVPILKKAIDHDKDNYRFYRELGYAYTNQKKVEKAEKTYRRGIEICNRNSEKAEMAQNVAYAYYVQKNRKKFDEWAKITTKYAAENSRYAKAIAYFKSHWKK